MNMLPTPMFQASSIMRTRPTCAMAASTRRPSERGSESVGAIAVIGGVSCRTMGRKSTSRRPARETRVALERRRAIFRRRLLAWFRRHGRDLPWRRTRDPWRALVSEVMLQQTQVARVLDFYPRFLARSPTLRDLAAARPAAVREAWDGLGYYR